MNSETSFKMNETIYVRIRGGLGNQMFQYAFAYMLSKKYVCSKLILDIREYKDYYWPFELDCFNLPTNYEISTQKLKYDSKIKSYHFYQGIYRRLHHKSPTSLKKSYIKKGYLFCVQYCEMPPDKLSDDIYLYGYFQNADLLAPIREDLSKIFVLKEQTDLVKKYLKRIKPNSVSINIRFAKEIELKNNETYTYSSKKYYVELVKEIKKRRKENIQLVISSNDIKNVKQEKWFDDFDDVVFVENCSAIEQLEIMKHCRDFVLSNSTFSWWIGYLGSFNKDSVVLAPKTWFQGQDITDTKIKFEEMEIR